MNNIVKEVSTLTTISDKTLAKLFDKFIYCICDAVKESMLSDKQVTELEIGLGKLFIKHEEGEIKYRFIPSDKLEKGVTDTVVHKENILEDKVEEALVDKFTNLYKNLF